LDPDAGGVEADAHQLHQVLLNLCVNGRDAMPQGGTLTIATGNAHLAVPLVGAGDPVPAGDYIARVQNYAATSPDFTGTIKFGPYAVANKKPKAALSVGPEHATTRTKVKLDATKSADPDGTIASYQWDLDGDGHFELNGKDKPTLSRHFKAGVHHVGVRVTDDKGARAYANATIKVAKAPKKKKK
jgi:hypothetical protein